MACGINEVISSELFYRKMNCCGSGRPVDSTLVAAMQSSVSRVMVADKDLVVACSAIGRAIFVHRAIGRPEIGNARV